MQKDLLTTVTNLGSPRVLLVGDFVLDSYVYGDALRISPEAPVQVLKVVDRQHSCGGAASVAADVMALGGQCLCVGVVGVDGNGALLRTLLAATGADTSGLTEMPDRPTTSKQRLIGLAQHRHRQQLLRIDEENSDVLDGATIERILALCAARLAEVDVVCLQDYNKGVLAPGLCRRLIDMAAAAGKPVLVDPPMTCDYSRYAGATIITPNRREASQAAGMTIESIEDAARAAEILLENFKVAGVVITLDKEGAYLKTADISVHVPTVPRSVYDVTGAGDMVLAMLAVSLAAGCDPVTAVELANIAGGLEVEKFGVATVTIEEIVNELVVTRRGTTGKIQDLDALVRELQYHRYRKQAIVFTNGCFDVLHRGHIEYLQLCRRQGDIVVVGLNSDASVKQIKGPERPINIEHDRAAVLAALEMVDYIVIFDEPTPLELITRVSPDVLVKGEDWADKGVVGREFVESRGGKVVLAPLVAGRSSTATIERLKSVKVQDAPKTL
ncbi:MAG: D-glycero-beta-D-manno-heptose 1-phosphate adenylyltransferase [Phycisphaerae bacterium]|nr:D-glycero-beta-D-manno-heptose 1-phosphate adenylyltransferase [Phycisphaerae bacterium]